MVINITYTECMESIREEGTNVNVIPTLRSLRIKPIPFILARSLINRNHYLHSFPGGTKLSFGIFYQSFLMGAITLGVGPIPRLWPGERARLLKIVYYYPDCGSQMSYREIPNPTLLAWYFHVTQAETNLKFVVTYSRSVIQPHRHHLPGHQLALYRFVISDAII